MTEDLENRITFDNEAELYHAVRPNYPEELFETLITDTKLDKNARLLEIGPGTGQATKPLAEHGYHITAIELGENLFRVAKEKLAEFSNVELILGDYETIELPENSFDLVYAATAFHWLMPETQFQKTHRLLREGGHLAIIETKHVSDEKGDRFFNTSQMIYERYAVSNNYSKPKMQKTAELEPFEVGEKLFELVAYNKFPLEITYSTDEFINLLRTYSPVIARPKKNRELFLEAMKDLVEQEFDGRLTKNYAMTLTIARKTN